MMIRVIFDAHHVVPVACCPSSMYVVTLHCTLSHCTRTLHSYTPCIILFVFAIHCSPDGFIYPSESADGASDGGSDGDGPPPAPPTLPSVPPPPPSPSISSAARVPASYLSQGHTPHSPSGPLGANSSSACAPSPHPPAGDDMASRRPDGPHQPPRSAWVTTATATPTCRQIVHNGKVIPVFEID